MQLPEAENAAPPVPLLERDQMITTKELADYLQESVDQLHQWASRGGGPEFHKIGNERRYDPADVKAWLRSRKRSRARKVTGTEAAGTGQAA